ncbi:probable WD repeat and SOCS box-containing protein 1 [Coccomyxa sp. Obi]|nr:probable WD repeat and SOCS box-containing protein 1 [Coccomyxa sp. Obi]
MSELDNHSASPHDRLSSAAVSALLSAKQVSAYGHHARIFDLSFSPSSSRLLASASDDDTSKIWQQSEDGGDFKQVSSFHGHTDSVLRVNWSPDGQLLASGSADTTVRLWRFEASEDSVAVPRYGAEEAGCLEGHPEEVYGCEFVSGGGNSLQLATGSSENVYLWDVATATRLSEAGPPSDLRDIAGGGSIPERWQPGYVFSLAAQPEGGKLMAACCSDGSVRAWAHESDGLSPVTGVRLHNAMGSAAAWHADGHRIAATFIDGSISVLDVRTWELVWRGDAGCPVFGCCFLPSAPDVLAVCCPEDHIRLFDTSAADEPAPAVERAGIGSLWGATAKPRQLLCIAAAADGSALAASGDAFSTDGRSQEVSGPFEAEDKDDDGLFSADGLFTTRGSAVDKPQCQQVNKQGKWSPIHIWHNTGR